MSDERPHPLIDAARLRAPLDEICAGQEENHRFLANVLSVLETLAAELVQRKEKWLSEAILDNVDGEGQHQQLDELRDKLQQAEQERAQFDQERMVLETELDTVRQRAAEMAETLEDQRRQIGEERKQWGQELKRMRGLLETLSKRPAASRQSHGDADVPLPAAPAPSVARSSAAPRDDPALESVVAQFEMLQRDIVRRRAATAECH